METMTKERKEPDKLKSSEVEKLKSRNLSTSQPFNSSTPKATMGRATALGVLARMAYDRSLSLEEVTALQMAVRCIAKRHFDAERRFKRRREAARTAEMYLTPPFALAETARQDVAPPTAGEPPALPGDGGAE